MSIHIVFSRIQRCDTILFRSRVIPGGARERAHYDKSHAGSTSKTCAWLKTLHVAQIARHQFGTAEDRRLHSAAFPRLANRFEQNDMLKQP